MGKFQTLGDDDHPRAEKSHEPRGTTSPGFPEETPVQWLGRRRPAIPTDAGADAGAARIPRPRGDAENHHLSFRR